VISRLQKLKNLPHLYIAGKNSDFIMTEKEFWDMFHKKHNPDYYYGKNTEKKKTEKKKNDRKRYAVKRYPVFKVQD